MPFIIEIILKLLTNPKVEAFAFFECSQLINKYMTQEQTAEQVANDQLAKTISQSAPLHLPRGSVRALLTLMLAGVISGSFIWHYVLPDDFYAMALLAIGYYVGYRSDNTQLPIIKS